MCYLFNRTSKTHSPYHGNDLLTHKVLYMMGRCNNLSSPFADRVQKVKRVKLLLVIVVATLSVTWDTGK